MNKEELLNNYMQKCRQDGRALGNVPEHLRTPELCEIACRQDGWALGNVPEHLRTPELCEIACRQYGWALNYVPQPLQTPELCEIACRQDGRVLLYVPQPLRTPELCEIALKGRDLWKVFYQDGELSIGCQTHTVDEWRNFSDGEINEMHPLALMWWSLNKDRVLSISGCYQFQGVINFRVLSISGCYQFNVKQNN